MLKHELKLSVILALWFGVASGVASGWAQPPSPPCKPCCWPPPCECKDMIDLTCCSVTLRVNGIANSTGWGGHFSLSKKEDGFGGVSPECYITGDGTATGKATVFCHDGFLDSSHHVNNFQLPLGPRKEIDYVEFSVGQRGVHVMVQRKAFSSFTKEVIPYQVSTFFPLREASGFCSGSSGKTLFIQENGVLSGLANRSGTGHHVVVEIP